MKKSHYSDLLKDPRWQKMRLEILQRDSFTCQQCGDTENTLHVHHLYYNYSGSPWEIPTSGLLTLCSTCHEAEGEWLKEITSDVIRMLKQMGYTAGDFNLLAEKLIGGYDPLSNFRALGNEAVKHG